MAAVHARTTAVGVFEDRRQADEAVAELKGLGFRDDQIGVAMRHDHARGVDASDSGDTYAEEGGVAGALTGLGLGALAGVGVLAGVIPVIGPAIAGGTLGIIFSNAAAGAALAGLAGALVGYGIPEEEAKYYHEEFEAGRTIVTVTANGRYDEAIAILRRHGAYDMTTRAGRATASSASTMNRRASAEAAHASGDTIQVKEERLHAEKRPIEAGEVRVRKEVHTETETIDVPVQREEVVIERTPVRGRRAAEGIAADAIREGEEIRIPVREERVNVTKDAVVTEEVRVGKRVVQDTEHVTGQVRKEEVHVEQKGDVDIRTKGPKKGRG